MSSRSHHHLQIQYEIFVFVFVFFNNDISKKFVERSKYIFIHFFRKFLNSSFPFNNLFFAACFETNFLISQIFIQHNKIFQKLQLFCVFRCFQFIQLLNFLNDSVVVGYTYYGAMKAKTNQFSQTKKEKTQSVIYQEVCCILLGFPPSDYSTQYKLVWFLPIL